MGEPLKMCSKRLILLTLSVLASSVSAQSAVEVPTVKEASVEKINVFELKRKLQEQTRDVQKLTKEVNNVEVTLGMNNKKYLRLAEERAKIEESLANARKNADIDSVGLKKNYAETKSLLMGVLLNKLENTENASDMLARKLMIERLQRKLADLDGLMKANQALQGDVEVLYSKLQDSMNTEKELLSIMGELEERKRELRIALESQTKSSASAQTKLDEEKNKMAMNQKAVQRQKEREKVAPIQITEEIRIPSQPTGEGFGSPINSYANMNYGKKGITFDFNGKNEVHAPKAGKVVHVGALANYGNVIMIDHGQDTRSVLFGQFDYTVKKDDMVRIDQVVGYTNPKAGSGLGGGSLYFEVRKKNLAQNTYLLLDKKIKTSSN